MTVTRRGLLAAAGLASLAGCDGRRPGSTADGPVTFDGGSAATFAHAVESAAEADEPLVVAEGTHRFDPMGPATGGGAHPHVDVVDVEGATIEGEGATIVFTNPTRAGMRFTGGADVTIRDLAFDYDPVPFTQGEIVGLSGDRRTIEVELDDGFPPLDHEMFEVADGFYALLHRPDGEFVRGIRKRGNWDHHLRDVSRVDDGTYRASLTEESSTEGLQEGRRVTVLARNNATALAFHKVDRPTLSGVRIHAANGAAFATTVCSDPVYRDCVIAPPAGSNRQIGADADGIRAINCLGSVTIEGCRHEYLGDDSVVVQHTMTSVTAVRDERTVAVADWHPFVAMAGDVLDAMSPTGVDKGALPPIDHVRDRFPTPGERGKPATITFPEPIDGRLAEGDFLRNRATGSGNFVVRDCEFREHRANLIRIAASRGVVEDNVLEGCSISPVELETDTSGHFSPKGWVRDVTVRNNRISRAGLAYFAGGDPAGVHVHHNPAPDVETEGRPNRRIAIVGNDVSDSAARGIDVEAAESVRIEGNELADLNRMDYDEMSGYGLSVVDSADVAVEGNRVEGSSDALDGFGWARRSESVSTANNELVVDGESREARLVSLVPLTLSFSGTVSWAERDPGNGDERPLAFYCFELVVVGDDGESRRVDVGGSGAAVVLEGGVFGPPSIDGRTGRWFGGESAETRLYLPSRTVEDATTVRLVGIPMDGGISVSVEVDGREGSTTFGTREPGTFEVDLA